MLHLSAEVITDSDFVRAFEACTLAEFHHRDHVRAAWLYLRDRPVMGALEAFCTGLKRFAAARGKPGLYHETITWAFVLLIRERRERMPPGHSWEVFAAANPDLLDWKESVLKRYYRESTLKSDFARRVFVLPDRILDAPE
ncbi:MAG TPA: hypothetical protein VGA40_09030 [Candidatus Acidoferrales bacterium]